MTINTYLQNSVELLKAHDVPTPRLDALVLIEDTLGIDRAKLLAEPNFQLSTNQKNVLDGLVAKRSNHVPVAQLIHKTEFYGRVFYIDGSVLEPRPESETMIDLLIRLVSSNKVLNKRLVQTGQSRGAQTIRIADIGSGSGALGITAKLELKNTAVDLIDIDKKTLKVAKKNVALHTIGISVISNDLLDGLATEYDILLCNLPYVPDDFKINLAATHEPELAIFGGSDGLDVYRKLFRSLLKIHHRPLFILTEALPFSHSELENIAWKSGYLLYAQEDFIQSFIDSEST